MDNVTPIEVVIVRCIPEALTPPTNVVHAYRLALAFCSVLLWMAGPARAQAPATVTGTVTDAATGAPVVDVNVVVVGSLYGAVTGAEGRYEIRGLPPDTYTFQVTTLGYRTARQTVTVSAGETATVPFRLTPESGLSGEGTPAPALPEPARVRANALRRTPDADLGAALQAAPGVAVTRRGVLGHEISIRGLYGGQVEATEDGVPLSGPSPLQAAAPLLTVDPSTVEQVAVVRGPYALTQGPGAMSALRVQTRPPGGTDKGTGFARGRFQTDARAAETAGALYGTILGAAYHVQGVYRTGQPYSTGQDESVPAGYESGAVRGRFRRALSPRSTLQVSGAFTGQRGVGYPGFSIDAEVLDAGRGRLAYTWQQAEGVARRIRVAAYATQALQTLNNASRLEPPFERGVEPPSTIQIESEVQRWGGRAAVHLKPHPSVSLDVGTDLRRTHQAAERVRGLARGGPGFGRPAPLIDDAGWPDVETTNFGAFARSEQSLGPIRTAATLRIDRETMQPSVPRGLPPTADFIITNPKETLWSAAVQGALPLRATWTLGLGGGSVARTPLPEERYADRLSTGAVLDGRRVTGQPRLDPERNWQADLWLTADTERLDATITAFARHIHDYITIEAQPGTPEAPLRSIYTNASASVYGGEIDGAYRLNPLVRVEGYGQYAWGEEAHGRPAPRVPPLKGRLSLRIEAPFDEELFLDVNLRGAARHTRAASFRGESPTDGYVTTGVQLGLAPASGASLMVGVRNLTDASYARPLSARTAPGDVLREPGRTFTIDLRVRF